MHEAVKQEASKRPKSVSLRNSPSFNLGIGKETKGPQGAEHEAISAYLSLIGKKGGIKGRGPARAKKLSAKKRKEIEGKAAFARWEK